MGEIVKTERDNKALVAATKEVLKKYGYAPDAPLGSLPWKVQSEAMQRAFELRKDFEK